MSTALPSNDHYTPHRVLYTRAWNVGSFLVLYDSELLLQVFADLQLKPASQELALKSLLRFLDAQYPDDTTSFVSARARELKRAAFRWLASGESKRFWGADEEHIDQQGEMAVEFSVLEWGDADDCDEIRGNVKELLVMMRPMMERFYRVSLCLLRVYWTSL